MNCKIPILLCVSLICFKNLGAQQIESMIKSKPVQFSGTVGVNTIFYSASGIPSRYLPFNYVVSGSPIISVYGVQIPFSFVIGKQQSSFTQPFNEFGMSPSYKWITVHAGYRNVLFSPYTLAGHTFLGGGIELNPGKFRFGFVYGRFNKATALDTAQSFYFRNFGYKRTGMSVKVGYGNDNNYFDLIGLKAKDDPNSLAISKGLADSSGITPAENMVGGYSTRLSFLKNHLIFESNGAISLYTADVNAPRLEDSTYEKSAKRLNSFGKLRTSSEAYSAMDASLKYKTRNFSIKVQYRRIDPGFQSMGAYFLNNDLENFTIAPTFMAWKQKIRVSGSLGIQHDDLTDSKRAKANKVIGSANLSADISERFGIDAAYSNYSVNQTVKTIRFADSLKVVQSSSQLSFTPRYIIPGTSLSHIFIFSTNLSKAKELNPTREDSLNSDINTHNYLLNYQLNFIDQLASVYISFNHTELNSQTITDENNGVTLGLSKTALKNKLNVSLSGGYLLNKRNGEKGKIMTGSLQCRYNFYGRHQLRATGYYTTSRPDNPTPVYPEYTETRVELGYGFSF